MLKLRRTGEKEKGATLVEFALVLPLLVLLLFGIIEFGWAFAQNLDVKHVAREVGRLATVDATVDAIDDFCSGDIAQITSLTRTGDTTAGGTAIVTAEADLQQITGMFNWALGAVGTLESTVEIRMEQDASNWGGSNPCP